MSEDTTFPRNDSVGQVVFYRLRADLSIDVGVRQNGFQLTPKQQFFIVAIDEQRLLSQMITRQQQLLLSLIPDGKREHTAQLSHQVSPVIFVKVDQNLGVRIGPELMSARFQLLTELRVVIDFPVEDDVNRIVFV